MEYESYKGKIGLITGASSGIGAATAVRFSRYGVKLAITGRDSARLEETARKCVLQGMNRNDIFTVTGDLRISEEVKKVVRHSAEHFGGLNFLVNCAGIIKVGGFMQTDMEDYDAVFDSNLRSLYAVTREAVPYLLESRGAIVNVNSFTGNKPCPAYFTYTLSGAAIDQFTRTLALELGPSGVRVNGVSPGIVKGTHFWRRKGAPFEDKSEEQLEKMYADLTNAYPLRRVATEDDITPAIVYLCSDRAGFVTGVTMPVDGGKVLTSKIAPDVIPPRPTIVNDKAK